MGHRTGRDNAGVRFHARLTLPGKEQPQRSARIPFTRKRGTIGATLRAAGVLTSATHIVSAALHCCIRGVVKRGAVNQDPELLRRLLRARDRMDAASHEEWPIRRLARVSGVSEAHFARSFRQAFGLPPHRYLLTRRIERATALLRDTDLPITEIAFRTGWESLGTFGRTFRDITGESPSANRQRVRAASADPGRVPACILGAAHRPDLNIAVSEKRRREAGATKEGTRQKEEVP